MSKSKRTLSQKLVDRAFTEPSAGRAVRNGVWTVATVSLLFSFASEMPTYWAVLAYVWAGYRLLLLGVAVTVIDGYRAEFNRRMSLLSPMTQAMLRGKDPR